MLTHHTELGKAQVLEDRQHSLFMIQKSKVVFKPVWVKGLGRDDMCGNATKGWKDHLPFFCPCVHSSIYPFIHMSVHLSPCLSLCASICPSVHPSTCLFTCLFICPSTCLYPSSLHPGSPAFALPLSSFPTCMTTLTPHDSWLYPSHAT